MGARNSTQPRQAFLDVLVGINLLREGLDLPEVTLVSRHSGRGQERGFCVQTPVWYADPAPYEMGGRVIMYADNWAVYGER